MTTNHHTPIPEGAAANASTFNAPLGQLDAKASDHETRIGNLEVNEINYSGGASEFLNGQGDFAVPAGTGSTNGHVIQGGGADKTQRAKLNFTGSGVSVVDSPTATEVQISTGGHVIQDEGVNLTNRPALNFTGGGVTVSDNSGANKTDVNIPAPITDHGGLTGLGDDDHPQYLKVADYTAPRTPNILINGGFDFFQRQTPFLSTSIANSACWADRWKLQFDTVAVSARRVDGISEASLQSLYYGTLAPSTGGKKIIAYQIIEGANSVPLRGKVVSFQIKLKASVAKTVRVGILELQNAGTINSIPSTLVTAWNSAGVDPSFGSNVAKITASSFNLTTSWQTCSVSATIPSNSKNVIVAIWSDSDPGSVTYSFAEAGLYYGTAEQAWRPGPIQDELNNCLRYYEKSYDVDIVPGTNTSSGIIIGYIPVNGNKTATPIQSFTAPKRTTPTIVCYTMAGVASNIGEYDASAALVANRAQGVTAAEKLFFYFAGASCTAGNTMRFHYTADCEL